MQCVLAAAAVEEGHLVLHMTGGEMNTSVRGLFFTELHAHRVPTSDADTHALFFGLNGLNWVRLL